VLFVLVSLSLATFPGEWHVNLITGHWPSSVQCERWFHQQFERADLRFDRLVLPRVDVVDDEQLGKIVKATSDRNLRAYEGERTRDFTDRDLNCSDLSSADLRRVDLTRARLSGATLRFTALQGAALFGAQLQGASLDGVQLQGAALDYAQLQSAILDGALLHGASLWRAQLQGASLDDAQLQGTTLGDAQLQGASLDRAKLQGAVLGGAQLQGASLREAQLQGANLGDTHLDGASLDDAQLQGTDLNNSKMNYTGVSRAYVWRAKYADCQDAHVSGHKADAIIEFKRNPGRADEFVQATPNEIAKFIERSIVGISAARVKEQASERMRDGLVVDPQKDDTAAFAKLWRECEEFAKKNPQGEFESGRAQFLRNLVCDTQDNRKAIANGIIRNWISPYRYKVNLTIRIVGDDMDCTVKDNDRRKFCGKLARGLLSEDGKTCAATKDLDESGKQLLRAAIVAAATASPAFLPVPSSTPHP
jgi:uncharacterized protein YjbI with pentapeptide repeats